MRAKHRKAAQETVWIWSSWKKTWTFKYTESVSTVPVILLFLLVQNQKSGTIIWFNCFWGFFLFFFFRPEMNNELLCCGLRVLGQGQPRAWGACLIQASREKQQLNVGKIISNWIHYSAGNVRWSSLSVQVPDWILLFKCTYYITAIQKGCKAHSEEM